MKEKLREIADITMEQSPSSFFYNNRREGIPFLQGCTTFGRLHPTYDTWTTSYNKLARPGDILFTVRAPVGDINLCQTETAIGRGIASIRAREVEPRYLFYLLKANKGSFTSSSFGTIYQSINKDKLGDVVLDIHDASEQRYIVGVIGSVDDLIENIESQEKAIINVLSAHFSKFSSRTLVPFRFYDPVIIKPKIDSFIDEKIYLDTSSIDGIDPVDYSYTVTYDNRPSRASMRPTIGSVWTAKMKKSFKVLAITDLDQKILNGCILSTGFLGIQSLPSLSQSLLFSLFISEQFRTNKDLSSTGATMEAINNKNFLSLSVPKISREEMDEYEMVCSPFLKELSVLREKKINLKEIKKNLLSKYF